MGTVWYDTMTTLGFLVGITEQVRLLSHVNVLPVRHPLLAAKAVATLDALSEGRAILGVGAGHVEGEFAALGADFAGRGRRLDDAIDVVDAVLREEFADIRTPSYDVRDVGVAPRPVQQPRPPIWVGGSSPAALRRAGQRGEGWLPQGTARKDMPAAIATIRRHRDEAGREDAIEIGALTLPYYVGEPGWDVGKWCIAGPPERLAEDLAELRGMGVAHVQVRFRSRGVGELVEQVEAFGKEVGPLLG